MSGINGDNAPSWVGLGRFVQNVGVPTALAVIVLASLTPKIDRGIQIADHVDAELQYLAARGCGP